MTVATIKISNEFISAATTKKLAGFVKTKYNELYSNIHWSNAPVLETVCFQEATNILNNVHISSDAHKMNKGFLEAIKLMGFDFLEEFQVQAWEEMILDLPLSEVEKLHSIDFLID